MDYLYANLIFFICVTPVIGTIAAKVVICLAENDISPISVSSCCDGSHKRLSLAERIPLISYILTKGKCKFCGELRTPIYFFAEVSSLLVFITIFYKFENPILSQLILFYSLGLFLIGLAIFDILTKRLPDIATLPFLIIGLSQSYWLYNIQFLDSLFGVITGGAVTATVAVAFSKLKGRTGVGWGDVKLIGAFGAWIGWQALPLFILLSSVSGILFIFFKSRVTKRININQQIPFGPFLCASGWLIWLQTIT